MANIQQRDCIKNVTLHIQSLSAPEFSVLTPQFVDLYIAAMNYPPEMKQQRIIGWRSAVRERNFRCFIAHDDRKLLGVAYGYHGRPEQWWHREVQRGLRMQQQDLALSHVMKHQFYLSEIHVHPRAQGQGIGTALCTAIMHEANSPYTVLSTPEVADEANGAFRLYRKLGFQDLLRDFHFHGDSRAFALLYRDNAKI